MKNLFSRTSMLTSLAVMCFGSASADITNTVNEAQNPELVKFLAPIIAGLLGKIIEGIIELRKGRKEKK